MQLKLTIAEQKWRSVLILLAICSLTVSLATRFWVPSSPPSHAARSVDQRSVEPKRQNLDRSSTQLVAQSTDFDIIELTAFNTRLMPSQPRLPKAVVSDGLYNRPPPSSDFLL
jgi:hypothetical protein